MKDYLLNEAEKFIDTNLKNLNKMSIYNIKYNQRFSDIDYFHNILKLDKSKFKNLIKEKEEYMLKELNELLIEYNLPVTAEIESGSNIVFLYKEEKIGRLNLYGGSLNIFSTSIEHKYKKIDINYYTKGIIFSKPMYKRKLVSSSYSIYTNYKYLDKEISNLQDKLINLQEKRNSFIANKERIKTNKYETKGLINRLSVFIYKKKWIETLDIVINSITNDIDELIKFIDFVKEINTSDNEYIEILSIKNGLEDVLNKELGLDEDNN